MLTTTTLRSVSLYATFFLFFSAGVESGKSTFGIGFCSFSNLCFDSKGIFLPSVVEYLHSIGIQHEALLGIVLACEFLAFAYSVGSGGWGRVQNTRNMRSRAGGITIPLSTAGQCHSLSKKNKCISCYEWWMRLIGFWISAIARLLAGRLHFKQGDAAFGWGFVQCADAADALLHSLHSRRNALLLGAVHVGCHLQQNIFR